MLQVVIKGVPGGWSGKITDEFLIQQAVGAGGAGGALVCDTDSFAGAIPASSDCDTPGNTVG